MANPLNNHMIIYVFFSCQYKAEISRVMGEASVKKIEEALKPLLPKILKLGEKDAKQLTRDLRYMEEQYPENKQGIQSV